MGDHTVLQPFSDEQSPFSQQSSNLHTTSPLHNTPPSLNTPGSHSAPPPAPYNPRYPPSSTIRMNHDPDFLSPWTHGFQAFSGAAATRSNSEDVAAFGDILGDEKEASRFVDPLERSEAAMLPSSLL